MTYAVEVSPTADKQINSLDKEIRKRIFKALAAIKTNPRPGGVKALTGHPGVLRKRVGDYRIVYTVNDGRLVVWVVAVSHRSSIYQGL